MEAKQKILEVKNLVKHFSASGSPVRAVDDISFDIYRGETLGLVGESGCGKSTTGRLTIRLIDATSGSLVFNGRDISTLSGRELRDMRRKMQIVFQDPFSSLDPRKTIGSAIRRPLDIHNLYDKKDRFQQVLSLMERVGLDPNWVNKYPHELDGGRRQRVGIARALAVNPEYIVCDEPVSALDVSVQAQVLNLMQDLQEDMGLTYLFISHDLSVVRHLSNRIAVMYLGVIVEMADADEIFEQTMHPYTQALLSAIPIPSIDVQTQRIYLEGDVPSPKNPPSGCRFHTRCRFCTQRCKDEIPQLKEYASGHWCACHLMESK